MRKVLTSLLLVLLLAFTWVPALALEPIQGTHQYPLTEETVTYDYMISSSITDLNESCPFFQELEALTNVHMNWITVPSVDAQTRASMMWGSGDLPDIIGSGILTPDDMLMYYPYGVLLPLNKYMDEYMPNFLALCKEPTKSTTMIALAADDGNIYALPKMGEYNTTSVSGVHINTQWLDKLGLAVPTTTDELFDVLVAFKEKDPNGNGQADEIPFATLTDAAAKWMNGQMNGWFGVTQDVKIVDGVVDYSPRTDGWKEMHRFMNRMWEAGLMDPEFFTQDYNTYIAKGTSDPALYGVFQAYGKYLAVRPDEYDNYELLMPQDSGAPVSGAVIMRYPQDTLHLAVAAVSAKVEKPELLMEWFDTLFDPYYGRQATWGAQGVHNIIDENGEFVQNNDVPSEYSNFNEWRTATHFQHAPAGFRQQDITGLLSSSFEQMHMYDQSEKYFPLVFNQVLPAAYKLASESDEQAKYITDIEMYVREMTALWISGERDIDADWDAYQAKLTELGVEQYVAAYQAYVDRVMALYK